MRIDKRLCTVLGNISNNFTINNVKNCEKWIKRKCKTFLKLLYKMIFGLTKKIFVGLLSGIVNASKHAKCMLLSNQKYII